MPALMVAVALLFGVPVMFQDSLLYFPDRPPIGDVLAVARAQGLEPWPSEREYRGLVAEPAGTVRATVVLFHGNAGHAGHRSWYADELTRLGLRVILAEYPGYGPRPGELGERALVADAAATVALARRRFDGPLLLAGESLGAAVATAVANDADASALLLVTPWDRLASVARHHYPWLPIDLLLRDRYDNVANLGAYRGRIAVVVAERDSIVPAAHGRALFEKLPGPKRLWTVGGADHNDWFEYVDASWWGELVDFLLAG